MDKLLGYWLMMVFVFFADRYLFGGLLTQYGIRPQELSLTSLIGLFAHAFLHIDLNHLISNSYGFLPLGFMAAVLEEEFQKLFWKLAIGSGVITWVASPPGRVEIGSSGVVFGFFGYLIGAGIRELKSKNYREGFPEITFASLAVVTSGRMLPAMLPIVPPQISWQGHLAGFVVGLFLGFTGG